MGVDDGGGEKREEVAVVRSVGGVGVSGSRDVEGSVCHTPAAGGGGAAM